MSESDSQPLSEINQTGRNTIDQLLRTTHQHHMHLSAMADKKASFLIAAASVMLTLLMGKYADSSQIPMSLLVLGGCTLVAACMAVLCLIPHITGSPKDPDKINLLFFGHFGHLTIEEYRVRMEKLIKSDKDIYHSIIDEIYYLGEMLNKKKYRYLIWAYRFFFLGIIGSALLFIIRI